MLTEPEVRVRTGVVRGRTESGVGVFRGIPYASRAGRFGAPGPAAGWDGVRDAADFGPPPPQPGMPAGPDDGWLTVNVWTPDPAARLPVMVWVQGGGYVSGTSGLPEYDGARLAARGVVVVTFNHRVGIEGFALVDGAPANRGLLDQVAALEWVRDNIGAFGGDAGAVTVFGESAGAGCVAALLAMPRAAGLFRRAIVQSMPGTYFSRELAADIARVLSLGTQPLPADAGRHADRWGLPAHRGILLSPVVDGDVLPTDPWRATSDVDLIVGHTRHEHRLFMLLDGTLGQVTEEQAATALALFAPGPYDGPPEAVYEQVHSDWLFRMPSVHLADTHRGRTHLYELTWPAPAFGGALGACHGLDVPLVFGNLTAGQPAALLADDLAAAEAVSARFQEAWTAFAATGDPGWPPYRPGRLARLFDVEPDVVPYPPARPGWQQHAFGALPLPPG